MGMMLESTSSRLLCAGEALHRWLDKVHEVRLAALETAGQLRIPFTTGILEQEPAEVESSWIHDRFGSYGQLIASQEFRFRDRHEGCR